MSKEHQVKCSPMLTFSAAPEPTADEHHVWKCSRCGKVKDLHGDHLKGKTEVRSDCWPCAMKRTFKLVQVASMSDAAEPTTAAPCKPATVAAAAPELRGAASQQQPPVKRSPMLTFTPAPTAAPPAEHHVWKCSRCGKVKDLHGDHLKGKTEVRSDCWPCAMKRTFKLVPEKLSTAATRSGAAVPPDTAAPAPSIDFLEPRVPSRHTAHQGYYHPIRTSQLPLHFFSEEIFLRECLRLAAITPRSVVNQHLSIQTDGNATRFVQWMPIEVPSRNATVELASQCIVAHESLRDVFSSGCCSPLSEVHFFCHNELLFAAVSALCALLFSSSSGDGKTAAQRYTVFGPSGGDDALRALTARYKGQPVAVSTAACTAAVRTIYERTSWLTSPAGATGCAIAASNGAFECSSSRAATATSIVIIVGGAASWSDAAQVMTVA